MQICCHFDLERPILSVNVNFQNTVCRRSWQLRHKKILINSNNGATFWQTKWKKIQAFCTDWWRNTVFHGVSAITNAFILYRRDNADKNNAKSKNQSNDMKLYEFRIDLAKALCASEKKSRDRNWSKNCASNRKHSVWCGWAHSRVELQKILKNVQKIRYTYYLQDINLCFSIRKNCFKKYHTEK